MISSDSPSADAADFEDLFENAPCGYVVLTPDGRIKTANATFAAWIGAASLDLVGRPLRELLSTPSRIFYETILAPLLHLNGRSEEVALDLVGLDGRKLALFVSAAERKNAQDNTVDIRLIAIRAAERRSYERDLQSREAAAVQQLTDEQALSVLRERFIAVLGHDLRNPLAAVSSGVRLLQRDPSRERADQIAAMMHASVLRMNGMIENLLDFARGRMAGGISLHRAPADLKAAMAHVVDELHAAYPTRAIKLVCDLDTPVDCDISRLSQMLSNLVGNAITHGDPAIDVVITALIADGRLEIVVSNGGAPIPDHQMRTLFEPFSHEAGTAPRQGLGLGLYISSQIAQAHGGELSATSSADETKFTFQMPLASA